MEKTYLVSPLGSKVSSTELQREVDEYFEVGAFVRPGNVVFDVGANIGAFSLRIAEKCQSDVSLYCFEPSPNTYKALKANFASNHFLRGTRHVVLPIGLTSQTDTNHELSFFNFRYFPTNSTFDYAGKQREFEIFFEDRARRIRKALESFLPYFGIGRSVGSLLEKLISSAPKTKPGWWIVKTFMGIETVQVKVETLDEVIAKNQVSQIDLLKIDVEGSEVKVLQGLSEKSWKLIKQVVLETHNHGGCQSEIEALLKSNGFTDIRIVPQKTNDNGLDSIVLLATREYLTENSLPFLASRLQQ